MSDMNFTDLDDGVEHDYGALLTRHYYYAPRKHSALWDVYEVSWLNGVPNGTDVTLTKRVGTYSPPQGLPDPRTNPDYADMRGDRWAIARAAAESLGLDDPEFHRDAEPSRELQPLDDETVQLLQRTSKTRQFVVGTDITDADLYPAMPAHLHQRAGVMHVREHLNTPLTERWWITSPGADERVEIYRVDLGNSGTWHPLGVRALVDVPRLIPSITVDQVRLGAWRRSWDDESSVQVCAPAECGLDGNDFDAARLANSLLTSALANIAQLALSFDTEVQA